jgi:hypothetical protein
MSDKILTSVARKRSFPKASSNITKHLKEMEDAINDLEEQTPKAVAYERCVTAIMLIPEMLGEKSDGSFFLQVADGSSDFLHKFLSLSFIQMYHPSYPLPIFSQR